MVADYANKHAYAVYLEKEADDSGFPQISIEELEVEGTDALEEEIYSFLKAIQCGEEPVVNGQAGRDALAVALNISSKINDQMQRNGIFPQEYSQNLSKCR